jgi:hypothetical protein
MLENEREVRGAANMLEVDLSTLWEAKFFRSGVEYGTFEDDTG